MDSKTPHPLSGLTGHQAELFKLWISFFPVAPFFGVDWRFATFFPGTGLPGAGTSARPVKRMGASTRASTAAAPEVVRQLPVPAKPVAAKPEPVAPPPAAETVTLPEPQAANVIPIVAEMSPPAPEVPVEVVEPADQSPAETPDALGPPANLFTAAPADVDDLKLIKGIGPGLESKLNALGIYRFDQIAAFTDKDLLWIDDNLTTFKGRCFRDDWVGQAKSMLH